MALCGHSPARSADFRDTLHSWEVQPLGCSQLESTELKLGGGGEGRGGEGRASRSLVWAPDHCQNPESSDAD